MATQANAPDYSWFKREDYRPVRKFSFADWAVMLKIRWNYEHAWSRRTDRPANNPVENLAALDKSTLTDFWSNYLREALPWKYGARSNIDRQSLRTIPPLEDITGKRATLKAATGFFDARILKINLDAPDEVLRSAFGGWLKRMRKDHPLPVRRRGRRSDNVKITRNHLKSWAAYHVLAVIDLDFCARVFGARPLSYEALYDHLCPPEKLGQKNPMEWGRSARDKAKEARKSLELLTMQGYLETGKSSLP
jgi:hypothetical protein